MTRGQAQPPYVIGADTNSATRTYYANGQLATLRYADGSHDAYSYDHNGEDELLTIRAHLQQERALGDRKFQVMVEMALGRPVHLRGRGRPKQPA